MHIRSTIFLWAFVALTLVSTSVSHAATDTPVPPCMPGAPYPSFTPVGSPPAVAVFHDTDINGPDNCFGSIQGPLKMVIALAGSFSSDMNIDELAARVGAISSTKGLVYWSSTNTAWRQLISEAFAVADPADISPRPDFSATEVLSGDLLYFAQNDTRSAGQNVYELSGRRAAPNQLTIEINNVAPIKVIFFPLFGPRDLITRLHFIRQNPGIWHYYSLSAIRDGGLPDSEKSLINRAAAFFRHIADVPADMNPPLAP